MSVGVELRRRSIALYKQLSYLGRDYPLGADWFHNKLRNSFIKTRSVTDPVEHQKLIARGEYVVKEIEALYRLRKYRELKKRYYAEDLLTPEEVKRFDSIAKSTENLGKVFDRDNLKTHHEKYIIGHSRDRMYEIVSDVSQYKQFLPWCQDSFFIGPGNKDARTAQATLDIGYSPFIERYTSMLTMDKPNYVRAVCQNGRLFKHLETIWRFGDVRVSKNTKDLVPNCCSLEYQLRFESSMSLVTAAVNSMLFDAVAKEMVNAFLKRANQLYGPPSRLPIRLKI